MRLDEKISLFETLMNKCERHEFFEIMYIDGSWEKIQETIKNTEIDFNDIDVLKSLAERVVQAINWNCRIVYALDTTSDSVRVIGYEGKDGKIIKDSTFVHPFSKLPGFYPTYNFFD